MIKKSPVLAIETGIEPEYENALIQSAKNRLWDIRVVNCRPFDHKIEGTTEALKQRQDVWFHGSIQACKVVQEQTNWIVHANWKDLTFSAMALALHHNRQRHVLYKEPLLFNEEYVVTHLSELKYAFWDYPQLVEDNTLYVRPDGSDKLFNGGCISVDTFEKQWDLIDFYSPPKDTPIIVARPQKILSEARFLVVNGVAITGSIYKSGGQSVRLKAPKKLMEVGRQISIECSANDYKPSESWVLDLAQGADHKWKILEVGATSCCGMYKCDTQAFIDSLLYTIPRSNK